VIPLTAARRPHVPPVAALALAIDASLLLLFAAVGRRTHEDGSGTRDVLVTAAPFVLGWLAAALALGVLRAPLSPTLALRVWALALPLALLLRWTLFDRGVAASFAVVALAFTALTLVGWRLALAALRGVVQRRTPR
jgi:hypothetical protein